MYLLYVNALVRLINQSPQYCYVMTDHCDPGPRGVLNLHPNALVSASWRFVFRGLPTELITALPPRSLVTDGQRLFIRVTSIVLSI